jgi:hypothetical protein
MPFEIFFRVFQHLDIISRVPEQTITVMAQQPSNPATGMIVVYVKLFGLEPANGTSMMLGCEQIFVLLYGKPILAAQGLPPFASLAISAHRVHTLAPSSYLFCNTGLIRRRRSP